MDDSTAPPIELAGGSHRDLDARGPSCLDELGRKLSGDEKLANLRGTRTQEGSGGVGATCDVGSVSRALWRMFYSLPSVG
jgi:hypothetical protein